ncbi:hypothetical protein [Dactylosporangium sp. NPDC006015]|uniref:hypothetical protein n=1 Tax=Dactylosporangium sp. NPDC006015 TaxID=3154576 RepID=UPI0033BC43DA
MTVTAVQITRRPAPASTTPAPTARTNDPTGEPADVVIVADIETLTRTNQPGCSDDNPYR